MITLSILAQIKSKGVDPFCFTADLIVVRNILLAVARKISRPWLSISPCSSRYASAFHKIRKPHAGGVFLYFVDPIGFEPMTSSLQMRRSTN